MDGEQALDRSAAVEPLPQDVELDTRSEDVRRLFETTDEAISWAVAQKLDVRWMIVEKRRLVRFEPPPWLEGTTGSETRSSYEVN